jgi:hypothetical protein
VDLESEVLDMIVDRIIEIEKENHFFNYKDKNGLPLWDIVRYDVIKSIEGSLNKQTMFVERGSSWPILIKALKSIGSLIRILFLPRRKYLFSVQTRYKDSLGFSFDRNGQGLMNLINKETCAIDLYFSSKTVYSLVCNPPIIIDLVYRRVLKKKLPQDFVDDVCTIINQIFSKVVITPYALSLSYNYFLARVTIMQLVVNIVKPKAVFISSGEFKPLTYVAKRNHLPCYLFQHSLIEEKDYTLCGTCPTSDKGVYPDFFLTYGTYWGDYMKHLTKVIPIGNDYLSKDLSMIQSDGSLLFISSLYQGRVFPALVSELARKRPQLHIIYKLHPQEFSLKDKFESSFVETPNVKVMLDEEETSVLIRKSKLVVLISSTVFYEAISLKRPVAVWNHPDFASLTRMHKGFLNGHLFTTVNELIEIVDGIQYMEGDPSFYEPFNNEVAKSIIKKL